MNCQIHSLFPTHIVRTDTSGFITLEDQDMMMKSVDQLIEMGMYAQGDLIPKYQTHVMLFQDDAPPIWHKLKKTFHDACETYLKAVPDFCRNQDCVEFTASGAWAYKGWKSINGKEGNPWHHHNPAFLSGVYYLKVPGNEPAYGTEFHDPRTAEAHGTRFQSVPAQEFTWIIFPGWLSHKSIQADSEEPRYVIAANMYAKIR
jgi:hypothetical protein